MRKYIDIINATLNESTSAQRHAETGEQLQPRFLRINNVMNRVADGDVSTEESTTRLLQNLNYLCDAIREFGSRHGGEVQRRIDDAIIHLHAFLPRDGDIEGAMSNPQTLRNIRDGMRFLRTQLRADGFIIESVEHDPYEGGKENPKVQELIKKYGATGAAAFVNAYRKGELHKTAFFKNTPEAQAEKDSQIGKER